MLGDSLNKKNISFQETVSVLEAFWVFFLHFFFLLFQFYLFLALFQSKEKT